MSLTTFLKAVEEEKRKHKTNTRKFKRETDIVISNLFVFTCANVIDNQNEMIVPLKHHITKKPARYLKIVRGLYGFFEYFGFGCFSFVSSVFLFS